MDHDLAEALRKEIQRTEKDLALIASRMDPLEREMAEKEFNAKVERARQRRREKGGVGR